MLVCSRVDEITGGGVIAAQELIAEIGVDVTRFPTAAHLVSWAKFARSTRTPPARNAVAPPVRATPGWAAPSARSSSASQAPTPSSANATDV
jgi:hypothetical protein